MTKTKQERSITHGPGFWAEASSRFRGHRLALVMALVILGYAAVTVLVSCNALAQNWNEQVGPSYQEPCWQNPMGTDLLGRSVLRKAIYGAKTSFSVAILGAVLSVGLGAILGAVAGYYRGVIDELIVFLYSTISSIPRLLMMLALAFVLRDIDVFGLELRGIPALCLALGLSSWVGTCRLIRGEMIKHKDQDCVQAAAALGCTNARVVLRHIFPNLSHLIIIQISLRAVGFIKAEVMLSFLGLGPVNYPTWGVMIDDARFDIGRGVWWQMAAATSAVFLLSLALNVVGDTLRDVLDPKLKNVT